jgi:alkanesulfonate monooxygenase SsuD/methylene tetrahydromethanopterin reductase-like flavin-dependent oxidoreductase (luciferase family)
MNDPHVNIERRVGGQAPLSSGSASMERVTMDFGVHLPLADLGQGLLTGRELRAYTATAAELGFDMVCANDHLVWRRPWLDGMTCLASVLGSAGGMKLATSVALPAVRHPVVLAKAIASLGMLADGPVVAGLGPGSSAADYEAVGLPFTQRWARFDECLRLVRALVRGEAVEDGHYYQVGGLQLDPLPSEGKDPASYPDAIATAWMYVTREEGKAERLVSEILAPLLGRDPSELLAHLPIGTPEHCVELLDAYAAAGASRILLWPIQDPIHQLQVFSEDVRPHLRQNPR